LVSGYSSFRYVESLADFGVPRELPLSNGWLLERPVRDGARDLMGAYPLFACRNWGGLAADLEGLERQAVSVVLVADPLGGATDAELRTAFPDVLRDYRQHHVRDLDRPWQAPAHHRRHIRRAAAALEVEVCAVPANHLEDWTRLYAGLAARHGLVGIRAFSRTAFERQLALPGLVAVRALRAGRTVGMALWLADPPVAHYHLAAYSAEGYEVSASYALFDLALQHLEGRAVRLVDLGGAAADGLERFKRGWANEARTAYLCGRVLDRPVYERLAGGHGAGWFPAYRAGERDLGAA
jgi:Acetyltransferase (GNAT) domain